MAHPTNRIFIGNLASELEEFTIFKYCSAYGEISKCQIMKDPKTDQSRGFGFITYAQSTSAQAILDARPHYIGHHKINVKPAFPNSEVLLQNLAIQPSSLHSCIKTRRLFVAYNTEEAKRNNLVEPAIFGYLSAFGVVKEIVQQFTSSDYKQQNPYNDYWIVEFLEEGDIERCMAKGTIHYFSGVRIHMKKVFSEQDLLRRKRKLAEEAAQAQKNLTESVSFNTKHFKRRPPKHRRI